MVWAWFGLAWLGAGSVELLFVSLASAWFELGLARFGLVCVWFGDVFFNDAVFPRRSATVRRNPSQSVSAPGTGGPGEEVPGRECPGEDLPGCQTKSSSDCLLLVKCSS